VSAAREDIGSPADHCRRGKPLRPSNSRSTSTCRHHQRERDGDRHGIASEREPVTSLLLRAARCRRSIASARRPRDGERVDRPGHVANAGSGLEALGCDGDPVGRHDRGASDAFRDAKGSAGPSGKIVECTPSKRSRGRAHAGFDRRRLTRCNHNGRPHGAGIGLGAGGAARSFVSVLPQGVNRRGNDGRGAPLRRRRCHFLGQLVDEVARRGTSHSSHI
jgi:hypothetical protein